MPVKLPAKFIKIILSNNKIITNKYFSCFVFRQLGYKAQDLIEIC